MRCLFTRAKKKGRPHVQRCVGGRGRQFLNYKLLQYSTVSVDSRRTILSYNTSISSYCPYSPRKYTIQHNARQDSRRYFPPAIQSIAGYLAPRLPASYEKTMAVSFTVLPLLPPEIYLLLLHCRGQQEAASQSTLPEYDPSVCDRSPLK